tara:strand:- start:1812 stop:1931 length:120 start_codon:yes stop_codon:yes gene_type:complete
MNRDFEKLFQSLVMFCDANGFDISEWEAENEQEPQEVSA